MWLRFDADHSGEIDHEETIGIIECILDGKVTPETFHCIVISIINMITRHLISSLTLRSREMPQQLPRGWRVSWGLFIFSIDCSSISFTHFIFMCISYYFHFAQIFFPRRRVDSQDRHRWQRNSWWTGILDSKSVLHFSVAYNCNYKNSVSGVINTNTCTDTKKPHLFRKYSPKKTIFLR